LADFLKSSPLKPLGQMNQNLVGSIYGRFGEDFFRNQPIRNKNCLWRPSLLTDRDEMSNLYRSISKNLLWNCIAKWTKTWWEAPMKDSVLSFLQAEWKVSIAFT
jgi:hypothetical protein